MTNEGIFNANGVIDKYTITPKITDLTVKIGELLGHLNASEFYGKNLRLRKTNRVRSVQSSAAIEGNTLSFSEALDVIDGKTVLGNPNEILEIKNAFSAYEEIMGLDPYSKKDLLILVPNLMKDLLAWGKETKTHPLITSCIIHYEIELIHPFQDGNGRMGRLWQTLILTKWHEIFAWIPIETLIYENQEEYYSVLHKCQTEADSTLFIEFMLDIIAQTIEQLPLDDYLSEIPEKFSNRISKTQLEFLGEIIDYIKKYKYINNSKAKAISGRSTESVKKYLNALVLAKILMSRGDNKGRIYRLNTSLEKIIK
ncbi:MAG: Fic family protein [Bifidobacteriaceae bacterium]|jgi:Fic family protein|nr:Fic family protein [Bifidobacteriaceae bacterium]